MLWLATQAPWLASRSSQAYWLATQSLRSPMQCQGGLGSQTDGLGGQAEELVVQPKGRKTSQNALGGQPEGLEASLMAWEVGLRVGKPA